MKNTQCAGLIEISCSFLEQQVLFHAFPGADLALE